MIKRCAPVDIFVPSAFTPNGDGLNERLKPVLSGFAKMNYFRIYNREGKLIYYSTDNNSSGWDGTYKGNKLPAQVLVWVAEGVDVNGKVDVRKGTVVLLR